MNALPAAAAAVGSGFLSSLGEALVSPWALVVYAVLAVIAALRVLAYRTRRREPLQVIVFGALPIEVGDDTLAMLRGEMSDAAIEQWLKEDGRNG